MIQSMTGFGKATVVYGTKKINVEIKSLNSKTLDLSTRIAPLYREKEMDIRNLLSKKIRRGKVDFSLWVEKDETEAGTPINTSILMNYYQQIKQIATEKDIPLPADWFSTLLRMPDIMTRSEVQELDKEEWAVVEQTIEKALQELDTFRQQEGEALAVKFEGNIAAISQLLKEVEPFEKERVDKIRTRITEALEKTISVDYDKNRLEQELIYYIEKLDINEEKQRLSNHLSYFLSTMKEEEAQGKKLGFIAQEMGREINTTGSKSNHAEMQNIVVRMKDELEQIKEQVLNVM
ncbi:MAG: YicC/YloC family endoribonuclease [Bacteroidaceae bacterium]|nr:YicC family protein [Bacteroidaceae bacterium]